VSNNYAHLLKSIAVLVALGFCALPTLILALIAQLMLAIKGNKPIKPSGRTVLLTGGKMTKCLQLARMFHALGDRIIVAETPRYRWCGTRFSNVIHRFVEIPAIVGDGTVYREALIDIAKQEKVDLFVPVASPKAAIIDSIAKPDFPSYTKVFHVDEAIVRKLDSKHAFIKLAASFGLSTPESHLIDSLDTLLAISFTPGKQYILKKIEYDPVYRLDLRKIPEPGWEARVKSLPIGKEDLWVLQEFIEGREVCTHTTAIDGNPTLYVCADSSPFQVNYEMLHLENVRKWVDTFIRQLQVTGQLSFDFIIQDDGTVMPIECNPRTHSAITLFHNQTMAARGYYESSKVYMPNDQSRHTYWIYHELYRMLVSGSFKRFVALVKRVLTGKEAVFQWEDPWPFWFNNHVNIPYQIIQLTRKNGRWIRIDFNIGKLVTAGGD